MNSQNFRFLHLADTITTSNHLLFSFVHLLSLVHPKWTVDYVKSPISQMFVDVDFNEDHFILLVGTFELHHGISIPESFLDYSLSIEEFVEKASKLPVLNKSDYEQHVEDFREIRFKL